MNTPASLFRQKGKPVSFKEVLKGESFECNGNIWIKHGKQIATGIWPACLPAFSYFRNLDLCYVETMKED